MEGHADQDAADRAVPPLLQQVPAVPRPSCCRRTRSTPRRPPQPVRHVPGVQQPGPGGQPRGVTTAITRRGCVTVGSTGTYTSNDTSPASVLSSRAGAGLAAPPARESPGRQPVTQPPADRRKADVARSRVRVFPTGDHLLPMRVSAAGRLECGVRERLVDGTEAPQPPAVVRCSCWPASGRFPGSMRGVQHPGPGQAEGQPRRERSPVASPAGTWFRRGSTRSST